MARLRARNRTLVLIAGAVLVAAGAAVAAILLTNPPTKPFATVDASGIPLTPITAQYVNSRPDAHIVYPGAAVVHTDVVREQAPTAPGSHDFEPARVTTFIATTATPLQVRAWYQMTLSSLGYECYRLGKPAYDYTMDTYIKGGRELVWVGYVKPRLLAIYYGFAIPQGRTIIEVNYLIRPGAVASVGGAHFGAPASVCFEPILTPAPSAAP